MDLVQVKSLSTGQIALWYALMYINNKCAWAEWFTVPNNTLELYTSLSRQGIIKCRNVLKQCGVIDFKSNGTKAASYKLITMLDSVQVSCQDSVQVKSAMSNSVQSSVQDSVQSSVQNSSALNKLNETKLNKTNINKIIPTTEFSRVTEFYEKSFGTITTSAMAEIESFLGSGVKSDLIIACMQKAIDKNIHNWGYAQKIIFSEIEKAKKAEIKQNNDNEKSYEVRLWK